MISPTLLKTTLSAHGLLLLKSGRSVMLSCDRSNIVKDSLSAHGLLLLKSGRSVMLSCDRSNIVKDYTFCTLFFTLEKW